MSSAAVDSQTATARNALATGAAAGSGGVSSAITAAPLVPMSTKSLFLKPSVSGAQPAGTTAANFPGILSAAKGGYNVEAQADPAFAAQLVTETYAMIVQDLTAHSNAFGVGGYQFPANAPFGPSNPLFTGQSYGPTWFASSGTPEPPPSDWAIGPITGLPHDPATGGSVTPNEWAVNPWNPDSPNYDAGLYTAAGQTPPA